MVVVVKGVVEFVVVKSAVVVLVVKGAAVVVVVEGAVVVVVVAPSAGMPFQPKNSIIGDSLKKCSRRPILPFKLLFFLPKRWKAISAEEFNNRGHSKKVPQEVIFKYQIDIFPAQALESHFSPRIQ